MATKKRYRSVIAAVYREPWAILPGKLDEILGFIDLKRDGLAVAAEDISAIVGSRRQPKAETGNGVAVLNVLGTIMPRASGLEQASGVMSLQSFTKAFDAAMANDQIGTIVGYFDTPGGAVQGLPEAVAKVVAARGQKKLIAYGDGTLASAGLWLASAFDEIIVSPSSNSIGSVGVVSAHVDDTEAMKKEGLVRTYMVSDKSPFKVEGVGALTEGAKTHQVDKLNAIYEQFAGDLAANLNVSQAFVEKNFGKGRTFMAKDALAAGMVHRIATFEQVLSELGVVPGSASREAASRPENPMKGTKMTPEEINALAASIVEKGGVVPATVPAQPAAVTPPIGQMSASDIMATIKLANIPDATKIELATELTAKAGSINLSSVLDRINSVASEHNAPSGATTITAIEAEQDKFTVAARDSILAETWGNKPATHIFDAKADDLVAWKPTAGRDYSLRSPMAIARRCLTQMGVSQHQMDRLDPTAVAQIAMGADPRSFGIMASGGSYNVTGMFSNIFYDASNVMLRRSYSEVNTTFQRWMKQGESLKDFKPVHKIIAGEMADPKAIPEDGEFEESTTTDGRESYRLTVWGQRFSISWQAIVNDRLGAFTDAPIKQGRAMRRKQNKLAYNELKANAALSDTGLLFNSTALTTAGGHNNLATGSATPTVLTLNAQKARMRAMTGLNVADQTILNIEPRFIIAGGSLEGTILALLFSMADPASTNSGVANIWKGGLEPIIDSQLDAAGGGSDTAWYLAADNSDVDTLEYAYLQGLETPRLLQRQNDNALGMKFDIYQAFAVKAIDFRGLQKHNGA